MPALAHPGAKHLGGGRHEGTLARDAAFQPGDFEPVQGDGGPRPVVGVLKPAGFGRPQGAECDENATPPGGRKLPTTLSETVGIASDANTACTLPAPPPFIKLVILTPPEVFEEAAPWCAQERHPLQATTARPDQAGVGSCEDVALDHDSVLRLETSWDTDRQRMNLRRVTSMASASFNKLKAPSRGYSISKMA
jgi:hypothetical protein